MSSCCGGNCGCGSSCGCGSGCKGCGKYADLSYTDRFSASQPLIIGVAPTNPRGYEEGSEMGTENDGCKCGPDCKCNPCNCK